MHCPRFEGEGARFLTRDQVLAIHERSLQRGEADYEHLLPWIRGALERRVRLDGGR